MTDWENRQAILERVALLLDLGRPQEAAHELSQALARSPEDPTFWRLISAVHGQLGEHGPALLAARRSVAFAPEESHSQVTLALALWNAQVAGRPLRRLFPQLAGGQSVLTAPTLAALHEALRLDPHNAEAHVILADLSLRLNRFREARLHYLTVLRDDPGHQDARLGLASLALVRRRPAEAEIKALEVLAEDPVSVRAMQLLAAAQMRRGRADTALDTALAAVRLEPANEEAQEKFRMLILDYLPPPSGELQLIDSVFVWVRNRWRLARLSPEMRTQVSAVHRQQPRSVWRHPAVRIVMVLLVVSYVTLPILMPSPVYQLLDLPIKVMLLVMMLGLIIWMLWKRRAPPRSE